MKYMRKLGKKYENKKNNVTNIVHEFSWEYRKNQYLIDKVAK